MKKLFALVFSLLAVPCLAADLNGNWAVKDPRPDGTFRATYFDLHAEGSRITGTIRVGDSLYKIVESTGDANGFTLTASMMDDSRERRVTYTGKLVGDDLQLSTTRRNGQRIEMVAHRAPPGEGAYPERRTPPALHKVADNGLVRTPPMGWNSWNKFAERVDDAAVRGMADAMASNGMKAAGYTYINIDDTWESGRDSNGNITTNKKFPDMKALADYVHSKGLKIGIYSSPGPNTCAGYEGSYGHEEQDAKTYASWGFDYLKYDWCSAHNLYTDKEMQAVYQIMGDALLKTGRPIVFSLCQYGRDDVWKWGPDVGGNLWRTTDDINDTWKRMSTIGFSQNDLAPYASAGHWNDPDMLEIGNGGMTNDEYKTHMSLWSILAAPLLAGNDLRDMPHDILEILTNREVIAVNQDKLGKQGHRISKSGDQEVWARELADGGYAVGLFNLASASARATVNWLELGLASPPSKARDLWAHNDIRLDRSKYSFDGSGYTAVVPAHGVAFLRIAK